MIDWLAGCFNVVQQLLFEQAVLPAMYALGLMHYAEPAFDAVEYFLLGVIQLIVGYALLRPLEAFAPMEAWPDRKAVRPDVLYTLLHRLGVVPLAIFAALVPVVDGTEGQLRLLGYVPADLESLSTLLASWPLASFLAYLVILDFADYWRHRLQHRLRAWWALHSLHHSQRQMSFWTDDRNHLLDDLIAGLWFAAVALLIGVPPDQFVLIVMLVRLVESLSHVNARVSFGRVGDRLLVSPRYHRLHHAIGVGHEGPTQGCNFATLFPLWDVLFGTANFVYDESPTGVSDQLTGRDYGESFLSQQWLGMQRFGAALRGRG